MSQNKYQILAEEILNHIGGSENVNSLVHCSTRLRFSLKNSQNIDVEAVKTIPGVLGVINNAQFQIVIGQDVEEVYNELIKLGNFECGGTVPDKETTEKKKLGQVFLAFLIDIFAPLVPAMTGAGMLKAFMTLFATLGWVSKDSGVYTLLTLTGDAIFYFLPVMVAYTTAKRMKCDQILAVGLVGLTILPKFASAIAAEGGLQFLGFTIPNYTYSSQIFPAIITVIFLSYVEKYAKKIMPKPLRAVMVPVLCALIVVPISVLILSPLGFIMGDYFTNGLLTLYEKVGWIMIAVLAALLPFMTAMGMHKPLVPYITATFASVGYEMINAPAKVAHNISEAGACFAIALKSKNSELKATAASAGISAFFGITEPALYGVTLQNKSAMIGVVISGFVSAAFMGIFKLRSLVLTGTGILGIVQFIDPENASNIVIAAIGYVMSISISFVITLISYKENKA